MSGTNRKSKISALLMASLMATNIVFANDAYKNNVVDVKVIKESGNAVKVTIYTDKPYTEPVVVNKKANNKYVILMPETKSSLKSAPSINNVAGTVSNVSVNTQDVTGGKGYTKIVITSEKAITVVPRTQQLSSSTVSTAKPATNTTVQQDKAKQLAAQKAQQEKAKQLAVQKAQQEKAKQLAEQKAQQEKARQLAAQKAQQEKAKQLAAQKAQQEKIAQKPVAQNVSVSKQTTSKKPIEILEQEVKDDSTTKFVQNSNDSVLNKEINDNIQKKRQALASKNKKKNTVIFESSESKISVIESIKAVIRDYQNISLWKLLLLASAITFPVVVIMIILGMDKRINKRIDKSFKKEDEAPQQEQVYNEFSEQAQTAETIEQMQPFNSFEDMLNQVDEPIPSFHEEQLHKQQYSQFVQSVDEPVIPQEIIETQEDNTQGVIEEVQPEIITEEQFENDFVKDDFEHDFVQEEVQSEVVSETEYVEDVPAVVSEEVLEQSSYTPDGYLSDFAGVDDKDFFDELVLQSMAENNLGGLPEESPADEIFDFMTEDENQNVTETVESIQEVPDNTEENEFVPEDIIEQDDVEPEEVAIEDVSDEEIIEDKQVDEQVDTSDNLTMLTEAKISDTTGLYLVNYDNFSSLVGHIDDDYFVIKKFDEIVNSGIVLKQTEKLKDSTRYLVRVGKNKMVVEVSPTSMSRLLDL